MGKVRKDGDQKELVYDWSQRDVILREAKLPALKTKHGASVRTTTAQLILYKINSRAGKRGTAWPTIQRLMADCNDEFSERTIRRVIESLEAIGVLMVERRRVWRGDRETANYYTIVWSELALLCPNPVLNRNQSNGHLAGYQSDILPTNKRTPVSDKALVEAPREAPPPTPKTKPADPWRKVEEDFRTHLGAVSRLVKQFKNEGKTPADLRSKLEEGLATVGMAENRDKFKSPAGAVFAWIESGVWPVAEVLSLEQERERLARVAEMDRQREAADAKRAQRTASQAARLAELEQSYGATLDALERWEMAALLDNEVASGLIMNGRAGMLRPQLLESLAQRNQTEVIDGKPRRKRRTQGESSQRAAVAK